MLMLMFPFFFHFHPLFLLVSLFLYFLPAYLARNKSNFTAIFVLNLLAGWTFIGWIIALVWALSKEPQRQAAANQERRKDEIWTPCPRSFSCEVILLPLH